MEKVKISTKGVKSKAWKGNIPLASRYTAGVAGDKFFKAIRDEGKLLGTYCEKCKVTYVPAKLFCERCFMDLSNSWKEVGDSGRVYSFTVVHLDMDGNKLNPPQIVGIIEMDSGQARMVHLLGEVLPEHVKVGRRVKAVWKPQPERQGKITDIKYFKPTS